MIGAFSAVGEVDVCVELFNVLLLLGQAPAHAHAHGHVPPPSPRAGGYMPPPSPSMYGSTQPPSTPSRGGGGGMGGMDEHEVHGPHGEAARGQQAGVDAEVGGWVLHAVCMHRAWDKAVQLLKVLQVSRGEGTGGVRCGYRYADGGVGCIPTLYLPVLLMVFALGSDCEMTPVRETGAETMVLCILDASARPRL